MSNGNIDNVRMIKYDDKEFMLFECGDGAFMNLPTLRSLMEKIESEIKANNPDLLEKFSAFRKNI